MNNNKYTNYALTSMRLILGLLFFLPGLNKVMGLIGEGHMLVQMIGLPLTWVLALVEVVFGLFLILGFKAKTSAIPLSIVMLGAIVLVVIPSFGTDPMAMISLFFHLLTIAALAVIATGGYGVFSLDNMRIIK